MSSGLTWVWQITQVAPVASAGAPPLLEDLFVDLGIKTSCEVLGVKETCGIARFVDR